MSWGAILFLAFINDLPSTVSSKVKLFADDCQIYRTIESSYNSAVLQQDQVALEKWENDWKMFFNPQKCVTIRITRKQKTVNATYRLYDHDFVPGSKYLGVHINYDL
ncbi:hypothetical protein KP79_PYT25115 [Mizuhopecten yessoensis]|uniref:Uncharacterized protein n=1 Tax=Mizuhopecten yessoensis TaxID=6573 RepID=A0A210PV53_MIZYE|nr:hypothetical protein KP79_PYT25115 [Mizuhopecten yessoensis]